MLSKRWWLDKFTATSTGARINQEGKEEGGKIHAYAHAYMNRGFSLVAMKSILPVTMQKCMNIQQCLNVSNRMQAPATNLQNTVVM